MQYNQNSQTSLVEKNHKYKTLILTHETLDLGTVVIPHPLFETLPIGESWRMENGPGAGVEDMLGDGEGLVDENALQYAPAAPDQRDRITAIWSMSLCTSSVLCTGDR